MKEIKIAMLSLIVFCFFGSIQGVAQSCTTLVDFWTNYQSNIQAEYPATIRSCYGTWDLIFEDEFTGTSVDGAKWYIGGPPWGRMFIRGNPNINAVPNGSLECNLASNLSVSNGILTIAVRQEDITANVDYEPHAPDFIEPDGLPHLRTFHFTSGGLWSRQGFPTFGKYEIRCKIPPINGLFPGFWLYGSEDQEIDVFEFINTTYAEDAVLSSKRPIMTYHSPSINGDPTYSSGKYLEGCVDLSEAFHTYSVIWTPNQIDWYVDGTWVRSMPGLFLSQSGWFPVQECNAQSGNGYYRDQRMPQNYDMNMVITCMVTNFKNPLDPLWRGTFPKYMEVDYVKAWRYIPPCGVVNYTLSQYLPGYDYTTATNIINTSGNCGVTQTGNVTWVAGNYVNILPGFSVSPGASFHAYTGNCAGEPNRIVHPKDVELNRPTDFNIYPNPSPGHMTCEYFLTSDAELFITDITGKRACSYKLRASETNLSISCEKLENGVYLYYVVEGEKVIKSNKLVIIK